MQHCNLHRFTRFIFELNNYFHNMIIYTHHYLDGCNIAVVATKKVFDAIHWTEHHQYHHYRHAWIHAWIMNWCSNLIESLFNVNILIEYCRRKDIIVVIAVDCSISFQNYLIGGNLIIFSILLPNDFLMRAPIHQ